MSPAAFGSRMPLIFETSMTRSHHELFRVRAVREGEYLICAIRLARHRQMNSPEHRGFEPLGQADWAGLDILNESSPEFITYEPEKLPANHRTGMRATARPPGRGQTARPATRRVSSFPPPARRVGGSDYLRPPSGDEVRPGDRGLAHEK